MRSLSRAEVRELDRRAIEDYGLPGVVLMENAGRSAVELLIHHLHVTGQIANDRVTIVCGKGNNAGDGFVMARHLANRGVQVEVLLATAADQFAGDAGVFYHVLQKSNVVIRDCSAFTLAQWQTALEANSPGWIVDALLGTGLVGPVREPFLTAIAAINSVARPVFAVDLPSGLDCDTGVPAGVCIRATHTGTFVARKLGFDQPGSQQWTGQVHVLEIGLPPGMHP